MCIVPPKREGPPQTCRTNGNTEPPPSTPCSPLNIEVRHEVERSHTINHHGKANCKGAVATSIAGVICWLMVWGDESSQDTTTIAPDTTTKLQERRDSTHFHHSPGRNFTAKLARCATTDLARGAQIDGQRTVPVPLVVLEVWQFPGQQRHPPKPGTPKPIRPTMPTKKRSALQSMESLAVLLRRCNTRFSRMTSDWRTPN